MSYNDEDIICTEHGEIMSYGEAKNYHTIIERRATDKEKEAFEREEAYWAKQAEENQMNDSYHDIGS